MTNWHRFVIIFQFLVVVPEDQATKNTDHFTIEELSSTPADRVGPYIAAKFSRRTMPNTFVLGDGIKYGGFPNRALHNSVNYQIFVRAVVDTPQRVRQPFTSYLLIFSTELLWNLISQSLYTSSPFSDALSLSMITQPSQGPAHPFNSHNQGPNISHVNHAVDATNALTLIIALVLGTVILVLVFALALYAKR